MSNHSSFYVLKVEKKESPLFTHEWIKVTVRGNLIDEDLFSALRTDDTMIYPIGDNHAVFVPSREAEKYLAAPLVFKTHEHRVEIKGNHFALCRVENGNVAGMSLWDSILFFKNTKINIDKGE